jgi:hypothetical protein
MRRVITVSIAEGINSRYSKCKTRAPTIMPPTNMEISINASEVPIRKVVAGKTLLFPLITRDLCR